MNTVSNEVIGILMFLLPGFLAAAVFYSLTSHPRPSTFERLVQALIFTIIVQAIVTFIEEISSWTGNGEIIVSVFISIILGLVFVYFSNNDTLHRPLRSIGLTKENSHPSEWYSAFSRHHDSYVILHLKGERRLFGWPMEWPSQPYEGHFLISEGQWVVNGDETIPVEGVAATLLPVSEVEMIEFISANREPVE